MMISVKEARWRQSGIVKKCICKFSGIYLSGWFEDLGYVNSKSGKGVGYEEKDIL